MMIEEDFREARVGHSVLLCMHHVDHCPNYSTANQLLPRTGRWNNAESGEDEMNCGFKATMIHNDHWGYSIVTNVQEQRKAEVEHLSLRSRVGKNNSII